MLTGLAWRRADRRIARLFAPDREGSGTAETSAERVAERMEALAGYFTLGFLHHRLPAGSLARYPGAPSTNGELCDRMEGFTRLAPLWAAWLAAGRGSDLPLPDGSTARPLEILVEGLEAGTDPRSPGYWGDVRDRRQQLVEAADVALAVWLARDRLWEAVSPRGRDRIVEWLREGVDREVIDNNWHLFPVTIWAALRGIGETSLPDSAALGHYERFKSFHLGDGWFRDGPAGGVDYYNGWQMHYALAWIGQMLPSFDRGFREEALERFVSGYRNLIGPRGFPILGRSVCYRMAAPAPLVAAALAGSDVVTPGSARRALDRTWAHFIAHGALRAGTATQGYGRTDLRFLDAYSGPASPLWSLRSLVIALAAPPGAPLWTAREDPLPVEVGSFEQRIEPVRWTVRGDEVTGDIAIERDGGRAERDVQTKGFPVWREALDRWRGTPSRPGNHTPRFELARYTALEPFCGYGADTRLAGVRLPLRRRTSPNARSPAPR